MAGEEVAVLLQNDTVPCNPFWVPTVHESMVNFENMRDRNSPDAAQLFQQSVKEELEDDEFDLCVNQRGKKRRLSATQVQFLEKHFEVENKLEPERKIQLAKEIGLQPRQVAIWFQNRRARFKTKKLERDYNSLKSSYDKLKLDYENLLKEKENLNNQFVALKEKLDAREGKAEALEIAKTASPKMEDVATSSAKSDVFDSDSPHSYLDPVDACQVFESEFSQDEEDDFRRSLWPEQYYTKAYHEPPASCSGFEFSGEDPPFWAWSF